MARRRSLHDADVNIDSSHHIFGLLTLILSIIFMLYTMHIANNGNDPLHILAIDPHATRQAIQQAGMSMFKVSLGAIVCTILGWAVSCSR